ncbi:MAG: hypothetical protein IGQ88_04245 [Gloeomargaritaceae cyanobacterium C42_A2020_066]|nr:hypothetical protein [Gloeomargaritaceae cyanobacterium C42_A2020_066]
MAIPQDWRLWKVWRAGRPAALGPQPSGPTLDTRLRQIRCAVAAALAAQRRLTRQVEHAQQLVRTWERRQPSGPMVQFYRQQAQGLLQQWQQQTQATRHLQRQLLDLETQLGHLTCQEHLLTSRMHVARAQAKLHQGHQDLAEGPAGRALRQLEDQVFLLEAEVEVASLSQRVGS